MNPPEKNCLTISVNDAITEIMRLTAMTAGRSPVSVRASTEQVDRWRAEVAARQRWALSPGVWVELQVGDPLRIGGVEVADGGEFAEREYIYPHVAVKPLRLLEADQC